MNNDTPKLPKRMTAAVYTQYGSPNNISIQQVAVPEITSNDVLIRVNYSTVNRTDCGFLRGKPHIVRLFSGLFKPKSTILGCEFSGEVVAVGHAVNEYNIGDRVCGFKDDDYGFGGHAEYTAMSTEGMLVHIPDDMSYEETAPTIEGAHYALFYIRASGISLDHSVLINGTTGAIGSSALQIIKHLGAKITAVCDTANVEKIKSLGADTVIDYQKQNFTELNQKFDVVFDAVGKSTFGQCKKILKTEGIYMSTELGPYVQNPFLTLYTRFFGRKRVLFPLPNNTKADALYLAELMKNHEYKPLLDRTYKLNDIVSAYEYVEKGMKVGNVTISINETE